MWFFSLLATPSLIHAARFCSSGNQICVVSTVSVSGQNMIYDITSTVGGWVAFGLGSSMDDGDVIMTFYSGNTAYAQSRTANGDQLPALDRQQIVRLVNSSRSAGRSVFTVSRPITVADAGKKTIPRGPTDIIWAARSAPVSSPQSLLKHDRSGTLKVDLFSENSVTGDKDNPETFKVAHGIMMYIAWGVLIPAAIFIARYLKHVMGAAWFKAHIALTVIAILLTIASFALILTQYAKRIGTVHGILGIATFSLAIIQGILGQVINMKFNPYRGTIPWYDKAHWWAGRILFVLAVCTMAFGIVAYDGQRYTVLIIFLVFTAVTIFIFIFGQFKFGQVHHNSSTNAGANGQSTMNVSQPIKYEVASNAAAGGVASNLNSVNRNSNDYFGDGNNYNNYRTSTFQDHRSSVAYGNTHNYDNNEYYNDDNYGHLDEYHL